ncbi:DUF262 domain-containing protein [Bradyrhizobium sp. SZCCHNRI3043]|uniref:DUF262 domain-containing protein n=1 Tax=Bradyrhizobium sp. SZCCHNRI3043 TaxID=3057292 RepID=UPI0028EC134D|nr:DUF262 domain-containing protein [Bradyrhizobium sp. SZCCHNRI3043]
MSITKQDADYEGDDSASGNWDDYPLDSVFVRTETRTVSDVVNRIQNNRYILDPDFQRDFVWSTEKQSKLIESCVMRIPLPVFYVAEAEDGRIVVVDGLQRLTTFARFLTGQLRLAGLRKGQSTTDGPSLDGKTFSDLPLNLQERVLDTQLTMYILDAKAPERARLDIFERVNSGEALTRQQMRNALYNGSGTTWLKEAASGHMFIAATGGALDSRSMRDREAINRFCAFKLLGSKSYTSGDMDTFLAQGLKRLSTLSDNERKQLKIGFDEALGLNRELFGEHAFRRSLASYETNPRRTPLNISLFEVCTVTMFGIAPLLNTSQKERLKSGLIELIRDDDHFRRSISYSTNSSQPVSVRFAALEELISGLA